MIDHSSSEPFEGDVDSNEVELLVHQLIDEQLDQPGEARLAELLRKSPTARATYRRAVELHASLVWNHAQMDAAILRPSAEPLRWTALLRPSSRWAAAGIAAALTAVAFWTAGRGLTEQSRTPAGAVIARVESANGAVLWLPDGGRPVNVAPDDELTGGTFLLEGEFSHVAFRFLDGSRCYVSDKAELAISADGAKRLNLRGGMLTIDAVRQPPGHPMVLTTPETRVEVVGTSFMLRSNRDFTTASVSSGEILLRPLGNGTPVGIKAGERAAANLVRALIQPVNPFPPAPAGGRISFEIPPLGLRRGVWQPDTTFGGALRAEPFVAGRLPGNTPIVHSGVAVFTHQKRMPLAAVTEGGTIRMRLRTDDAAALDAGEEPRQNPLDCRVMLTLAHTDGRFAGNFDTSFSFDPGANLREWQAIDIPLENFAPLTAGAESLSEDKFIRGVLIATWLPECPLLLGEIEFLPPADAADAR